MIKGFSPESEQEEDVSTFHFYSHCTGVPNQDRQENEIEGIKTGKEEIKLLTRDRIFFVGNPKEQPLPPQKKNR